METPGNTGKLNLANEIEEAKLKTVHTKQEAIKILQETDTRTQT